MHLATLLIHPSDEYPLGALSPPIFQTASFEGHFCKPAAYSYSRTANPTRDIAAKAVADAEGGRFGFAFSSGLAALDALTAGVAAGEKIVCGRGCYGGTHRLLTRFAAQHGVTVVFADACDSAAFETALEGASLALIETPSNPLLAVADIASAAQAAHARHCLLAVDNTFLTPVFQRPLALGADIVLHSGTKYLCGHHDTVAGFLVTDNEEIASRFALAQGTLGSGLAPFDAFLVRRGMETLSLRMAQHEKNAAALFALLKKAPGVVSVRYPGDPSSAGYAIMKRQSCGFGGMLTFSLRDGDAAESFLRALRIVTFAESLGGNRSLITHPATQTHASLTPEERAACGIDAGMLRLSAGCEDCGDLCDDVSHALASVG